MKTALAILGALFIVFGVIGFYYQYFNYTSNENVAQIGNVKIAAETQKTVFIPPALSGIMILAGVIVVVVSITRKW